MNKRQAKKAENKSLLFIGMSYKEYKQRERDYMQYLADVNHSHKFFKGFNEDEEFLIEMGIFTEEELISMHYGRKETNTRWRQRRKYNKGVIV